MFELKYAPGARPEEGGQTDSGRLKMFMFGVKSTRSLALVFAVLLLLLGIVGCGPEASDALEEAEFLPVKEELVETRITRFSVPVPAVDRDHVEPEEYRNWLQVRFDLYAVVRPKDELAVQAEWNRQEGKFRAEVIKLCRTATLDELTEPALTTLKGRIAELALRRLGRRRVRSLVLTEVAMKQL